MDGCSGIGRIAQGPALATPLRGLSFAQGEGEARAGLCSAVPAAAPRRRAFSGTVLEVAALSRLGNALVSGGVEATTRSDSVIGPSLLREPVRCHFRGESSDGARWSVRRESLEPGIPTDPLTP